MLKLFTQEKKVSCVSVLSISIPYHLYLWKDSNSFITMSFKLFHPSLYQRHDQLVELATTAARTRSLIGFYQQTPVFSHVHNSVCHPAFNGYAVKTASQHKHNCRQPKLHHIPKFSLLIFNDQDLQITDTDLYMDNTAERYHIQTTLTFSLNKV